MTPFFLRRGKGDLAFEVSGSGPLVLCVPGMGDLRSEYRFLTPRLAEAGYRVATMDVRGHGETSAKWDDYSVAGIGSDILALIKELNGTPAVVIGTSMAAGAAVWAAAEAPGMFAGIILIGPAVRGEVKGAVRLLMGALFSRPLGPAAWKMYYTRLFPTRQPADFTAFSSAIEANLREPGRMRALRRMILASKAASEQRLPEVKTPALVIMGSFDPDFSDAEGEARRVAEALHADYFMIPESGHYPHVDNIEAVMPLVLPFLATVTHKD